MTMPAALRQRLLDQYEPVRPLPSPWLRATWVAPLAVLALVAAPLWFSVRIDAPRLGWMALWGASAMQSVLGLVVVAAAFRESVPGRTWSRASTLAWMIAPMVVVVAVTLMSWEASPILLRRQRWLVAAMCFSGSAATALPVVALASVLAARAYPVRPAIAGAMLGLGSGLMADAGWRIFCHFSEPAHVLSAHLAAVVVSSLLGAVLATALSAERTRAR